MVAAQGSVTPTARMAFSARSGREVSRTTRTASGTLVCVPCMSKAVAYPGIFFGGGGGSTNSVEDRENGDLGAVAP